MPNSFAFQEKSSEARDSKVSIGSRRRFFLEQKWKAWGMIFNNRPSLTEGSVFQGFLKKSFID
jgi:hypothetical protein